MKNKKKIIIASCFIVTVFLTTVASARIDLTGTWHPEGGGSGGGDPWFNATDTEAELEAHLVDVTDIFTNNDGALDDDDVTLGDVQGACTNDFHNIGGTDATDDTVSGTELDALLFGGNGLLRKTGANTFDTIIDNSVDWDTAFGWGDHSLAGYNPSLWNRAGTTLYPKNDGDDVQFNGSVHIKGNNKLTFNHPGKYIQESMFEDRLDIVSDGRMGITADSSLYFTVNADAQIKAKLFNLYTIDGLDTSGDINFYTGAPATGKSGDIRFHPDIGGSPPGQTLFYDALALFFLEYPVPTPIYADGGGDVFIEHDLEVWDNVYINDTLNVSGNVNISGDLNVTGEGKFGSITTVSDTELVTNGDFTADANWDKGNYWTIDVVDERAEFLSDTVGHTGELNPTVPLSIEAGKTYLVSFNTTIRRCTVIATIGGVTVDSWTAIGGPGGVGYSVSEYITMASTANLVFNATIDVVGAGGEFVYIDDVSIIEVGAIDGFHVGGCEFGKVNIVGPRRLLYMQDTTARASDSIVARVDDVDGNMLMNWAYSSTADKDLEIRFGDDENTKIGFPEIGYFAFINDATEFWLGQAADPTLYFNYYVGDNEYHGTNTNRQRIDYYCEPTVGQGFRVLGSFAVDTHISHHLDTDTLINFDPDRIRFTCGNEVLADFFEGVQDYVKLGDGGDVDINLNDDLTIDGATGDISAVGSINATGGFATDTGTGWSGTYTVTEGVVTVRNGIIIDVDWD